jgi:hypothetical protein
MGKLLILQNDGIYLPSGEKYEAPRKPMRAEVLVEYTRLAEPRFQKTINRKVGLNPFAEPLYRIVWGWSRLDWIAGLQDLYDEKGNWRCERYGLWREPKYSYLGVNQLNRWIVEKWIPPEMYGTPKMWEEQTQEVEGARNTQALGPYPSRGDYELSFILQEPDTAATRKSGIAQDFIQLTDDAVSMIVAVAERSREIESCKRKQFLEEEEARKEEAFHKELKDLYDDAAVAFGGNPNSTQANAPMHHTEKMAGNVSPFPSRAPRGMSVA